MSWVKLDDSFFTHPRAIAAGRNGRILYVAGLCWCKAFLTDGIIPKGALVVLAAQCDVPGRPSARALEGAGLWHDEDAHWRVNDWDQYQESALAERLRRDQGAERQRRWREQRAASRSAVSNASRNGVSNASVTLPDTDTYTDTDTESVIGGCSNPDGQAEADRVPLVIVRATWERERELEREARERHPSTSGTLAPSLGG